MLIRLKEANLYHGTRMIMLKFLSLSGYEHVMDYIGRYIENYRERDYNLIQASSVSNDIFAALHFYTSEAMKKFWNEHILVYGEQPTIYCSNEPVNLPETAVYFDIPESEGIRGGMIPVRTLKLDDLEEQRQKYKELANSLYGVASMSTTGPRKNGKSIFLPEYHYEPLKETKWEIPTIANYAEETEELYNRYMTLNNISNFVFTTKINLGPMLIRSIQINEKKRVVTIVWIDGAVTMAKCGMFDQFDVEKGIAIAFMKHWFNSTTQMNKWMREQTKDYYERTLENGFEDEERLPLKDLVQDFIKNAK